MEIIYHYFYSSSINIPFIFIFNELFISITDDREKGKESEEEEEKEKAQVTRGHNIVADGWARESNPHPTHTNIHKKYLKRLFFHFSTR